MNKTYSLYSNGIRVTHPEVGQIFIATETGGEMGTNYASTMDVISNELPGATTEPIRTVVASLPYRTYLSAWGFLADRGWNTTLLSNAGTGVEHDGSHVTFVNAAGEAVLYSTPILAMHKV